MMPDSIPPGAHPKIFQIAEEFMRFSYNLLGAYLDALGGLRAIREGIIAHQTEMIGRLKQTDPENASEQFLDQHPLSHEFDADQHGQHKLLHRTTQGEFKQRTMTGGLDAQLLGFMMVALLYGSWEDDYRKKFALALGYTEKNELKSELFDDLRHLRHATVHHNGKATPEVERAKILRWFKRGNRMFISAEHVDSLFDYLDAYVTRLCGISVSKK